MPHEGVVINLRLVETAPRALKGDVNANALVVVKQVIVNHHTTAMTQGDPPATGAAGIVVNPVIGDGDVVCTAGGGAVVNLDTKAAVTIDLIVMNRRSHATDIDPVITPGRPIVMHPIMVNSIRGAFTRRDPLPPTPGIEVVPGVLAFHVRDAEMAIAFAIHVHTMGIGARDQAHVDVHAVEH